MITKNETKNDGERDHEGRAYREGGVSEIKRTTKLSHHKNLAQKEFKLTHCSQNNFEKDLCEFLQYLSI